MAFQPARSENVLLTQETEYKLTPMEKLTELYELREIFRSDWPKHCVGYYCLDNFIRWLERAPEHKIKNLHIYTLNDSWRKNGIFVIVHRYQLFINAIVEDNYHLLLGKAVSLLDWSRGFKVSSFLGRQRMAIIQLVHNKELKVEYDSRTVLYYMPQTEAVKLDVVCPAGFTLRPLTVKDADLIDELWPNRHEGSLYLIKCLIEWNVNMGVYVKDTNELVAWCLRLQGGFLGALQVKDTHQRQGLGCLITKATAKCIAETGDDVMALVGDENQPSRKMFEKCGFQITDECYWLRTEPTIPDFHWDDNKCYL